MPSETKESVIGEANDGRPSLKTCGGRRVTRTQLPPFSRSVASKYLVDLKIKIAALEKETPAQIFSPKMPPRQVSSKVLVGKKKHSSFPVPSEQSCTGENSIPVGNFAHLKKAYKTFVALKVKQTGLGWDEATGTFTMSDTEWQLYLQPTVLLQNLSCTCKESTGMSSSHGASWQYQYEQGSSNSDGDDMMIIEMISSSDNERQP
ncbi:hypothetical protein RHMOL_Rhmol07G0187300 [Rhododendron molle]|uniref:Uncharacterized protein n=1 Tax=Rhododendron molle TaxID=49168 RepID=A0ACC0N2E2_RHOML|nr:hypothetical protein RHMOL_Rhmol07G0187300 [Rhododendron molle]